MNAANENIDPIKQTLWTVHMGLNDLIHQKADTLKPHSQQILEVLQQVKTLVNKTASTEADDAVIGLGLSVETACKVPNHLFDGITVEHDSGIVDAAMAFQIMGESLLNKAVSLANRKAAL